MPRPTIDITNQTFGLLTVIRRAGVDNSLNALWECRCKCGNMTTVRGTRLITSGGTKSCGCLIGPAVSKANIARLTTHGLSNTPTGTSWMRMLQRCFNVKDPSFVNYGARGIAPCENMRESPHTLITLIGHRPRGRTLDRIDSTKGYDCGQCGDCVRRGAICNVRWSTPKEQARNTRSNNRIIANGVTKTLAQWSEDTGLPRSTIRNRLSRGWPPERAIITKRFRRLTHRDPS